MNLRKVLAWQIGLTLFCIALSLWTWPKLPASVPVHWGLNGKPDRYGSPAELLFIGPVLGLVAMGLSVLFKRISREQPETAQSALENTSLVVSILFAYLHVIILEAGKGALNDPSKAILVGVMLMFAAMGNSMGRIKMNPYVGIRLPWTMKSETVWRESHRRAGYFWFYGGLGLAVLAIVGLPVALVFVGLMFLSFWPIWDSWVVAKRVGERL